MDYIQTLRDWCRNLYASNNAPDVLRDIAENAIAIEPVEFMNALADYYGHEQLDSVNALLSGPIAYILFQNEDEDVFYRKLWSFVGNDELFNTDAARELAVGLMACHASMPYRKANAVSMNDDEYAERTQKLANSMRAVMGMAKRPFAQKTEKGSAVLDIIDAHDDIRDRAVLMGILLDSVN